MMDRKIREVHYWWCTRCKKEFPTEEEARKHECCNGTKVWVGKGELETSLRRNGTS